MHTPIVLDLKSKQVSIHFEPTESDLKKIHLWLKEEYKRSRSGFYPHWSSIKEEYQNKKMVTLSFNDEPIGFACWRNDFGPRVTLTFFEIAPTYRHKGYGTFLFESLVSHFKNTPYCDIISLTFISDSARSFFESQGFSPLYPSLNIGSHSRETRTSLYKILTPSLPATNLHFEGSGDRLLAWNGEPHVVNEDEPTWNWKLKYHPGTKSLLYPIIFSGSPDWFIKLYCDGQLAYRGKIKYWKGTEIDFGNFIVLYEIPYKKVLKDENSFQN